MIGRRRARGAWGAREMIGQRLARPATGRTAQAAALPLLALIALLTTLGAATTHAQDPVREEQVVYSLLAYNGRQYVPTFAREPVQDIYLLADRPAVFAPRITFVYYWPLSQSWRVETGTLNIAVAAALEVQHPTRGAQTFRRTDYTYFNVPGRYENNWVIATGADAHIEYSRYIDLFTEYQRATVEFNRERGAYERAVSELASQIAAARAANQDATRLEQERDALEPPTPPARTWEEHYSVPPVDINEGFVLDLPPGRYQMRLLTDDGLLLQGSEKRLVAFSRLRSDGVGYEVMPGDRWTQPSTSVTPGAIMYVDGSTDLFLRPHFQDQYNDLAYAKLVDADGVGNARLTRWEKTSQIPDAVLAVTRDRGGSGSGSGSEPTLVEERPFLVEQVEGGRLGYRIVPYAAGAGAPPRPDIIAFRIPLDANTRWVRLSLQDESTAVLAGGERQIRVVDGRSRPLLLGMAALPLLALALVLIRRVRSYR